jgi:uncharacterized protein YwgA
MCTEMNLEPAEKIFLMLLYSDGGEAIPGNIWLQKEMFLIAKNLESLEEYLQYGPHIQGPYSEEVENMMENLQLEGLITKKDNGDILLTGEGEKVASSLYEGSEDEIISLIEDMKDFANDLTKDELLLYVYQTYPDMTPNSYEMDNLMPRKLHLAKKLYTKDKVSVEKASSLADLSIKDFKSEISDNTDT